MIYISGKITNEDPIKQRENLSRFYEVETMLNALGHKTFNPARLEEYNKTWEYYLSRDLTYIIKNRPTIFVMIGWETSLGAKLEVETAKQLGLTIVYEAKYND